MNNLDGIKRLLKLVLTVAVVLLVVKWCSSNFGSVIKLPGGLGESTNTESTDNDSGGWFSPRNTKNEATTNKNLEEEVKELERELGIGSEKGKSTTNTTTTTTTF